MSNKKSFLYEESHKHETHKSYKAYLEEMTVGIKNEDATEEADESSIRRSKRTPVPKRGFKLIDDYDSKKEPREKKIKAEEQTPEKINRGRKSNDKHNKQQEEEIHEQKIKPEKAKRGKKSSEKVQEVKVSVKQGESSQELEEEEITASRRSSRARKPKQFEDSICYTGKRKSSANGENKVKTGETLQEEADESSIRRSRRTPVPKRGFKLIDDYESKKEPPKKKIKAEEQKREKINRGRKSNDKHNKQQEEEIDEQKIKPEKAKRGRTSSEKAQEVKVSVKQGESSQELEEETTASRRSSRARKPKQFEDSIFYTGKRKSSANEENKAKTLEAPQGFFRHGAGSMLKFS